MEHLTMHTSEPHDPTVEEAPSPTGLYPGPVWALGGGFSSDTIEEEPEIPPSATGLYPGPVWAESASLAHEAALDLQEMYRVIRECATGFSGDDLYASVAGDQGEATGLAYGLVHFTQSSGMLGRVLTKLRDRDAGLFAQVFGADAQQLLDVTNGASAELRLRPVGGLPLWNATWRDRFRIAGTLPECQAAQNEVAIEEQFRPMLASAFAHGLTTDRALAVAFDLVATYGVDDGLRRMLEAIGPMPGAPIELIDRIVAATDGAVRTRLERLRRSNALDDISYRRP
jgi:hypothetical protein